VSKPIEPRELVHRLLRLLRQAHTAAPRARARTTTKAPSIEIDHQQATVRLLRPDGWHSLDLPRTEHRLLRFLLEDSQRVHSREEIRDAVWSEAPVDLRTGSS
jgi:two-component system OmpR family response regulator